VVIVNSVVNCVSLDRTLSALSDPTRRSILERLMVGPATVSELARPYGLSLPGVLKHVRVLEGARLVATEKRGRVRECRLGPAQLDDVTDWIATYRRSWESRFERLERYVEGQRGRDR
jgi:DNA-binding transcriptional ArsR family regulator